MSASSKFMMSIDEIAKELEDIESKYSPKNQRTSSKLPNHLFEGLSVLSKEFDSLGLQPLNLEKPVLEILDQVLQGSRNLVQTHRNAINQIRDRNIECRSKEYKKNELYNKLEESKSVVEKYQDNCMSLQNKSQKLTREIKDLHKREMAYKDELERIKRFHSSKQQSLEHNLKKLKLENERLKELFGKDIVTENSTNEVALKLLSNYKKNEEVFKSTIKTLQQNNRELLEEVLSLKEEVVLCNSK